MMSSDLSGQSQQPVQANGHEAGVAAHAPNRRYEALDLVPGFRNRLLRELDDAGVAPRRRVSELCRITNRAVATVRRWLDTDEPGLPDLESLTRLCQRLQVDVNYMLGLSNARLALPFAARDSDDEAWLQGIRQEVGRALDGSEPMVMHGDDMDPRIKDGDVFFVDRRVTALVGNGTYLIEYMDRTMVRMLEDRLSEGLLLRCANERYADVFVAQQVLQSPDFRIAGKIVRSMSISRI